MSNTSATATPETKQESIVIGDFGNGRYRNLGLEMYADTQRLLGFSKEQAHVTAHRLMIDIGRLGAAKADVKIGGTVNKDGYRTCREVASLKLPNSWAMSINVICVGLDTLRKQGLEVIEVSVSTQLLDFVNAASKVSFPAE